MIYIVVLLGVMASVIAIGLIFLPRAGWLARALGRAMAKLKRHVENIIFQSKEPEQSESSEERSESAVVQLNPETLEANVENRSSLQPQGAPVFCPPDELESCPCGLVLPSEALVEHRQSCGHAGIISFANVRAGKIWDLEQAIIEGTSPDCYKCGKPVKGLKRVGKTIYVSHLGCIDPSTSNRRTEKPSSGQAMDRTSSQTGRAVSVARRKRCPICWRLVRRRGSIAASSSTGIVLRFHQDCLRREALDQIVKGKIGGKPLRRIMN